MGVVLKYECDRCKRISNGNPTTWWLIRQQPHLNEEEPAQLIVRPLALGTSGLPPGARTLCSQACVVTEVKEFMEKASG